jgi:outer membrane protein assembly factor BamB
MNTRRLAFLVVAVLTPMLGAADWDRFRGPGGLGTAEDKDIPVDFAPSNFLWKTPIPGRGNSSPIVSKGKIFLQSASDDASKRMLYCIDARTGQIDWSREVPGAFAKTHNKNTLASSSPTADGERVYIVFWDGKRIHLTAWDYAGQSLWSKDLGTYASQHGPGLSPIVVGEHVILNVDQDGTAEVVAFDRKTGEQVWKKSRQAYRACYTTPFVLERDGKVEVIVSSTAGVTSYDPKTGDIVWNWTWVWKPDPTAPKVKGKKAKGDPLRQVGGPVFHDGLIYLISGDGSGDRHMVAIKAGTTGDVTDTPRVWEKTERTPYVPMVLAKGDYVFWIADQENKAICANAKTGKVIWEERLAGSKEVTASPVMIDGKIYSVNEMGRVSVFEAGPKFKLLADNDLKEQVYASPAVADGRLYIRGVNHLYCIGKK